MFVTDNGVLTGKLAVAGGHFDYRTTTIYADYAPDPSQGARYAAKVFGRLAADPADEVATANGTVWADPDNRPS